MQEFAEACAHRPDLLRVFLEIQVRAALEGVDMQGPARVAIQKVADLLDVSRIELAHMEAVLRLRREQFQRGRTQRQSAVPPAARRRRAAACSSSAAYQILEVDPKATDEEVAKAYRRQLSKHHPDKLKANGLPESMLEHAKQRTQQIIEAYELIKSARQARKLHAMPMSSKDTPWIAPSILSADFARLGDEVERGARRRRRRRPLRRDGQPLRAEPHHRPAGVRGAAQARHHRAARRAPDGEAGGPHHPGLRQGRRHATSRFIPKPASTWIAPSS